MVEVNLNCESDVTPDKYVIENLRHTILMICIEFQKIITEIH